MGPPVAGPDAEARLRLFFAVELSQAARLLVAELIEAQRRPDDGYRWVSPDALHLTLVFLGTLPAGRVAELMEVGQQVADRHHQMRLALGHAGAFGRGERSILWLGVVGEVDRLQALRATLAARLAEAGFTIESRVYMPHITLARHKASGGRARPDWPPAVEPEAEFDVSRLVLFESRLRPGGAEYHVLASFPLHR